jgi:hypothetical protein
MPVTTAGTEVENFIEFELENKGYNVETQVAAAGINVDWSRIDIVLPETNEAISLKYQDVAGTAEEKILYEAESLSLMCFAHDYSQGTIVLCGGGWSPVKYLWFLTEYNPPSNVRIISYDMFMQEYLGAVYA